MPLAEINRSIDVTQSSTVRWPFGELRPYRYRVILIDPPTKFSSGPNRNPKNHYPTMSIAEIAALPVGELAVEPQQVVSGQAESADWRL